MPFRFALDVLQRLRESFKQQEKLRLMALMGHLARLHKQIATLDSESRRAEEELNRRLRLGLLGLEVRLEMDFREAQNAHRRALIHLADLAEKEVQKQQVSYMHAHRAHEILERLRGRAWDAYRQRQRRREQQLLDELHLQSRARFPRS